MRLSSTCWVMGSLAAAGCWEMLPASRDPVRDALHRERAVCDGREPQSYPPGLFDPQSVVAVEPLYFARSERGSQEQHLLGATLTIHPPPGVGSEELERLLDCHAARAELHRSGEPAAPHDPYALPGHVVRSSVHFDAGVTRVEVEVRDVAGAQELLRRASAFRRDAVAPPALDEAEAFRAFHAQRLERLRAPDGWLTLVGLLWLKEGENPVGSADALRLPVGWPEHLGTFTRRGDQVSFVPAAGVQVDLAGKPFNGGAVSVAAEEESEPFGIGPLRLTIIRRGDRIGLRLRDPASPVRTMLRDIPVYPPDPAWRVTARFETAPAGHTLLVQNVLGLAQPIPSPGTAVFEVGGQTYRLSPVLDDPQHLFFVFGDLTNAEATYGAGRFLTTALPENGQVILDFNQAINPPCAFTAYATCPIPPKENRLPIRVEAGELRAGEHETQ